ncbi:MAG: fatty acid desaturase family protein [Pseudomonadales bacterium]|jgi:fatty acid desaturase|nr:fatty acid desaturase family protein [Pseudomonadales bacterium]
MNVRDVLTREELAELTQRSDARGAWIVLCQWLQVIAIFTVVALWTNPLTLVLGTILLGSRQLGFGILVHECGHRTLFATQRLNDFVGEWLAAPPTFNNLRAYMRGHLLHHRDAGTERDPDLPNYRDYPISRERLRRKLWRDLSGQTGWRTLKGLGRTLVRFPQLGEEAKGAVARAVAMNLLLFGTLLAVGEGALYLMWVAAYVFVFPAVSRIRQVAEHAAVPDLFDADPRRNTRTVRANLLSRAIFAPHQVNWHLEHHCLASVPIYHLRRMHRLLAERGYYDDVEFPTGYVDLLRRVSSVPAAAAA